MNAQQQQQFLEDTAWLRPITRLAAAFSFRTAGFLPGFVRNLPLKLVKGQLARAQKKATAGGGGCGSH